MPAQRFMEENSSATILAAKRLAGVIPEVYFREHVTYTSLPSANKAAHSGFEIRGVITRSPKQEYH